MKVTLPSLKLTEIAPEKWWLEDEFTFGARSIFRGYVCFRERKRNAFWVEICANKNDVFDEIPQHPNTSKEKIFGPPKPT